MIRAMKSSGLVIDLFAGAGGWDVAACDLGLSVLGVESDKDCLLTRRAAGLRTLFGDARSVSPKDFRRLHGLIASPPCTTFSTAGKGAGRAQMDRLLEAVELIVRGWHGVVNDFDPVTGLVLLPLIWALEARPEWIAMEQVPAVLPIWHAYSAVLAKHGYSTDAGVLSTELYGVPQTRKRAILIAHREHPVSLPTPTHSRYYSRDPKRLDEGVKPWVSIAEALGWTQDLALRYQRGAGMCGRYGVRPDRSSTAPSPTIRAGTQGSGTGLLVVSRADQLVHSPGGRPVREKVALVNNTSANAAKRDEDQPAPPIHFGNRMNGIYFAGAGATSVNTSGQQPRPPDEPAHTVLGKGTAVWVHERPATTVNGDPRISKPGLHDPNVSGSQQKDAIRVTVAEAAVLQGFPVDHPWQGTKTAQYRQVGNAIPPPLATAVLRVLVEEGG